jgi:hypothetical protein
MERFFEENGFVLRYPFDIIPAADYHKATRPRKTGISSRAHYCDKPGRVPKQVDPEGERLGAGEVGSGQQEGDHGMIGDVISDVS